MFDLLGVLGGAVFIPAGVIYVVAFNWAALGPWSQLSLVGVLLAICTGIGLVRGSGSTAGRWALTAGGALVGPLLVVYSQAYQTGADGWTLFAGWFLLALPWAALSRTPVANLGLLALLQIAVAASPVQALGGDVVGLVLACIALLWWSATLLWVRPGTLASAVGVVALLELLFNAFQEVFEGGFGLGSVVLLLVLGVSQILARRVWHDLFLLSTSGAVFIAWSTSRLLHLVYVMRVDGLLATFMLGLFVLGQAIALGFWVRTAMGDEDALDT